MKQLLILLGLLISLPFVHASNNSIRFKYLTIHDGLSLSSVYCVHRDSKGYMWFGTEDGLNRFDGSKFTIYNASANNPNSVCDKWIEKIYEDNLGQLWFTSRAGLSCFNPATEQFKNLNSTNGLSNDTITCLLQAHDSIMYVGSVNGLGCIGLETKRVKKRSICNGRINALHPTPSGIYVGASEGLFLLKANAVDTLLSNVNINALCQSGSKLYAAGQDQLFIIDVLELAIEASFTFSQFPLLQIEKLLLDKANNIWVGSNVGLFKYQNRKLKQIVKISDVSNSLAIDQSRSLEEDNFGNIWYGTHDNGVFYIQTDGKVRHIQNNPVDPSSLSQNAINCIYNDKESGAIWLGTFGAGLNMYHPAANKFELIKHDPINTNSLASDFIWSVCEASDGSLWIGTNDRGISRYIPSEDRFVNYIIDNNSVRCIYEDSENVIWIGTDGGGLSRFIPSNDKFQTFTKQAGNVRSLSDNSVRVIYEDSQNRMWIGTRNGLNLFDRVSKEFKHYKHIEGDSNSLSNNFIYSVIFEDSKGNIWCGTYGGGLNRLNVSSGKFEVYSTDSPSPLSNNLVFTLHEDNDHQLWIGTNDGLNVMDLETKEIRQFNVVDGLPNGVIYGLLPDGKGSLWLSTNHGLCCFDMQSEKCRNYDVNDGLQSKEFNGGAFHKGKSGKLYFGGVYGLNSFDPTRINGTDSELRPVFTGLEVMGQKVEVNPRSDMPSPLISSVNNQFQMSKNIAFADTIILDYKDRFFSLEFSGMDHIFPDKTLYAFQLAPMDKQWNHVGNRNFVTYANMKPGEFKFRVKCAKQHDAWSDSYSELTIIINPPFWLTYWFISFEVLLFFIIAIFIYRYLVKMKTNKVLKQQNFKISEANQQLRTSEANLKQMNATKDKFFSIISHDLKNPFSSLMSISEMLSENFDDYTKEDNKECVSKMNSSIKQIYILLENLLTWSRSQRGKISFSDAAFDLATLINVNINLYKLAADKKEIKISSNINEEAMAKGDRNTINTVVRNLMGNAMKFTNVGGQITINLHRDNQVWKVEIQDDGVGIDTDDLDKLFCIDKKLKTDGTAGEKGTGLGLIICKEFVEKNKGEIGVHSEKDSGSTFWFTVPKN
ncbi:ligand-binding sensor domain-containing protein [Carboxylicivirga sp. N1Y90]|uniref:ligand-binding sensor domain-containing protein n=1 Tax=Carboxylicivirga fragile TaxID=3417571 RepID=UPI003D32D5BF|nr:hypothetical protein [Marinilabiliaceae bacterium N1Y90]